MRLIAPVLAVVALAASNPGSAPRIDFWNVQRRGANLFDQVERQERLAAAHAAGMSFVRLAPNKWLNGRPDRERGDFLLGPRDAFTGIPPRDLARLRDVLDQADAAGLKVVLTMLSLPGGRWRQHNGGVEERRIWTSFEAQRQAIAFWTRLARALKGHPAVAGLNIRNEPSPERVPPGLADWYTGDYAAWYARAKDTPADLNLFYRKVVAGIREVDPDVPIILDSGFYATPWAFTVLEPVADDKVLYSFHMYEPYAYTSPKNTGALRYPGPIPTGETDDAPTVDWDRDEVERFLAPVAEWQRRYDVPATRILAGEFGVVRTHPGAEAYLGDVLSVLNAHGWHWAFYGFREDGWAAMDYELGTGRPPAVT